ncbi:glycosyltransferase family 4 protein [Flavobacterium haoranii]|uniref:Glycosyltransferase involved in cell wall bisynthesis n=1 Tax=Flavobacterium haoranii TaxID=683124 RepID=A0A1M6I4E0_9FLAO|nr:glycosyltransferase family 4 protein [Flavobacterium haoranii]SHJ29303.1 Glycosyltransferase involved in cell wall bisynthesis [Flavobacterium haoranii]
MQKHLVIIGTVWPEPNSTAAGSRMLQLIDLFQKQNFKITFLCSASKTEYSYNLDKLPITTATITLNSDCFNHQISELNPHVVLYDRFMTEEQYGWRVTETCPNALTILDTEDLHFLRKAREIAFKQNRTLSFEDYLSDTFKRELASIYRCDLSLIISEYEMELLTKTFKIDRSLLQYLPFLIEEIHTNQPHFSERKHFVSIGNFFHEPNWQTVLQLKKLWKSIKKELPDAEMHIYGAYASDKVMQLHNLKEGFLVKGRASSVRDVFTKARVLLAPIPFGAGLKGKLFESMQFGLPTVTSTIGAEGMQFNNSWNGCITDSEKDFVENAIQLYTNETFWNEAQQNGFLILENKFKTDLFRVEFAEKIDYLLSNLQKHRQENFLGHVFQHQSLQSTKFMSKWIELKNSKN